MMNPDRIAQLLACFFGWDGVGIWDGVGGGDPLMAVFVTVDGRQYRVSNPADERPEVQVFVSSKNNGWHWRRFPGNGERYRQIIELVRAGKKED